MGLFLRDERAAAPHQGPPITATPRLSKDPRYRDLGEACSKIAGLASAENFGAPFNLALHDLMDGRFPPEEFSAEVGRRMPLSGDQKRALERYQALLTRTMARLQGAHPDALDAARGLVAAELGGFEADVNHVLYEIEHGRLPLAGFRAALSEMWRPRAAALLGVIERAGARLDEAAAAASPLAGAEGAAGGAIKSQAARAEELPPG